MRAWQPRERGDAEAADRHDSLASVEFAPAAFRGDRPRGGSPTRAVVGHGGPQERPKSVIPAHIARDAFAGVIPAIGVGPGDVFEAGAIPALMGSSVG